LADSKAIGITSLKPGALPYRSVIVQRTPRRAKRREGT
jgi:hypothetical protein